MQDQPNRTSEKICPNCKGGNAPAAHVCQWCGTRLDTPYAPPSAGYATPAAPAQSKPRRGVLPVLLLIIAACAVLAVIGSLVRTPSSPGSAGKNPGTTGQAAQQASAAGSKGQPTAEQVSNRAAGVGDSLETADVRVTLNSVRRSAGDTFFKPKAGHEYVVLDLTYENTTAKETAVSSLISASVKDSSGQKYTMTLGGTDKSAPDGSIAPGDRSRGEVSFEVPTGASGLVFTFDPIFGGDPIRFSLDD